MIKRNRISLEDVKSIQLEMLKEIDAFCRMNDIRYSLAYGSLLGAIRHKGYIPWDDDVDLMMPLSDLLRFKAGFKSNLLEYIDVDTFRLYDMPFPRVFNRGTFNLIGRSVKMYGISIDLYPVVGLPEDDAFIGSFLSRGNIKRQMYIKLTNVRMGIARRFPINTIPLYRSIVRDLRDYVWRSHYSGAKVFYHHAGPFSSNDIFRFDVFDEMIEVDFEGNRFFAPQKYDLYLRQCYGDYMQLPPEDKRHPYHGGNYYWK